VNRLVVSVLFPILAAAQGTSPQKTATGRDELQNSADANTRPQASKAEDAAQRGLEAARAGDLKNAEVEFREAVNLVPTNVAYLSRLASILSLERDFGAAIPLFENALKLDPGNLALRSNLAASEWGLGRLDDARVHLEQVLKQKPGDQEATF